MTWDGRYSLEELDRLIPPLPKKEPAGARRTYQGSFKPHHGDPLSRHRQESLEAFLKDELGLVRHYDGRYVGPCPFPHSGGPSDGSQALYASPMTGSWHCFGSSHQGKRSGGVQLFEALGFNRVVFDPEHLSWEEVAQAVAQPLLESFSRQGGRENKVRRTGGVGNTVWSLLPPYRVTDTDALWEAAARLFPYPEGIAPRTFGAALYSDQSSSAVVIDRLSNTWRNPFNAQYKRRCLYRNIAPRLEKLPGPFYELQVPSDDWTVKSREALALRIARAGARTGQEFGYTWFDNRLTSGVVTYLTDVPMPDFDIIDDPPKWLANALAGISPPGTDQPGRFRPYGGSDNWVAKADTPEEQDAGRWETIGTSMGATSWLDVQATCIEEGLEYELVPKYWPRSQWGGGLEIKVRNREHAEQLMEGLGYSIRRSKKGAAARV